MVSLNWADVVELDVGGVVAMLVVGGWVGHRVAGDRVGFGAVGMAVVGDELGNVVGD
jgi:hypothetical protein